MVFKYFYKTNLTYAPFVLPLILLPLMAEWLLKINYLSLFNEHREFFLIVNILYIIFIRFALLDVMLFLFTRKSKYSLHITLIRIVGLYMEITIVTVLYFAFMFYILDVFNLFQYNANIGFSQLEAIKDHEFLSALYISTITFTTLGLGDWVPQTINAMMAISAEVILGVVQAGVFMAIIIYAHQNKQIIAPQQKEE